MGNPLSDDNDALEALKAERRDLVAAELNTYGPDDFPGSRRWQAHHRAELAVKDFDAAHPEVLAAIKAERAGAPPPEYVTDLASFYNRALRGED